MTPLEAVKEMAAENPMDNFDRECPWCGMTPGLHDVEGWEYAADTRGELHYPDCPWLQMPAIVKVLETLDWYTRAQEAVQAHEAVQAQYCAERHHQTGIRTAVVDAYHRVYAERAQARQALEDALKETPA